MTPRPSPPRQGLEICPETPHPTGPSPWPQAYAGHQFGGWVPALGDGRALLLGEVSTPQGRFDIQLKGSGPTPFSRRGDGRAWLGPVVREYLSPKPCFHGNSDHPRPRSRHNRGHDLARSPSSRRRLTRVASSHIRVGTFQYFAARGDTEALNLLTTHVISRHYPAAATPLD